jgi:hypothetical protein
LHELPVEKTTPDKNRFNAMTGWKVIHHNGNHHQPDFGMPLAAKLRINVNFLPKFMPVCRIRMDERLR